MGWEIRECGGKVCNLHLRDKAVDEVIFLRLSPPLEQGS